MLKRSIDHLKRVPLEEIQSEAFRIRKANFGNALTFSIPGIVAYHDISSSPQKEGFAAISVTGTRCELRCSHCKGKLLESMIPAETPDLFLQVIDRLRSHGARGILVSGGANREGEVPLEAFVPAIKRIKEKDPGFKILCHTGLIREEIAKELKDAGVDQILIDVIGDEDTIREVYHLNKHIEDYESTLRMLKEVGHPLAPHIIIGHHFGEIRGEWKVLEMITRVGVDTIVIVVLKSLLPVRKDLMRIPRPDEVSKISAIARILNPKTPIRMGCIRPAHPWKAQMEKGAIHSGVNTIAHPLQGTVDYAKEIGLETSFVETCCSIA